MAYSKNWFTSICCLVLLVMVLGAAWDLGGGSGGRVEARPGPDDDESSGGSKDRSLMKKPLPTPPHKPPTKTKLPPKSSDKLPPKTPGKRPPSSTRKPRKQQGESGGSMKVSEKDVQMAKQAMRGKSPKAILYCMVISQGLWRLIPDGEMGVKFPRECCKFDFLREMTPCRRRPKPEPHYPEYKANDDDDDDSD